MEETSHRGVSTSIEELTMNHELRANRSRRRFLYASASALGNLCFKVAPVGAFFPAQDKPISPKHGVIRLFNGRDLTGLYSWLRGTKREDPSKVFSVDD